MLAMGAGAAAAACQTSLDFGGGGVGTKLTLDVSGCSEAIRSSGLFKTSGTAALNYLPVPGTKSVNQDYNDPNLGTTPVYSYLYETNLINGPGGVMTVLTTDDLPADYTTATIIVGDGTANNGTQAEVSIKLRPRQLSQAGYVSFETYDVTLTKLGKSASGTATLYYYGGSSYVGGPDGDATTPFNLSLTNLATSGPSVTSISPIKGRTTGGTAIAINGSGFTANSTVKFGANPAASVTFVSATLLSATSPSGAVGTVDVTVTENSATSATSANTKFTYGLVPSITAFSKPVPYNAGSATATAINVATLGSVTGATAYTVGSPTSSEGGSVSISGQGIASYTPPVGVRGTDIFAVRVGNDFGSTLASVTVDIGDPVFSASVTGNGTYKSPFAKPVTMTGGKAPYSGFSATGLPPGLTMNANGTITGTPTAAGPYSNVVITATDSSNPAYTASATAISITIDKLSQTIAFNTPGGLYLGPDVTLTASSSSALDVTLTSTTTDICTLSGTTLTPIKEGTCTIEATQAGDANYLAATKVTQNITLTGQV